MSYEILKDLRQTIALVRANMGLPRDAAVPLNVPMSYAEMVRDELELVGVEVKPERGDEMLLEFVRHGRAILHVH